MAAAIAECPVVVDDKDFACDIETHRSRCRSVIDFLDKFVWKGAIALEGPKRCSEISEVVDSARQSRRHLHVLKEL